MINGCHYLICSMKKSSIVTIVIFVSVLLYVGYFTYGVVTTKRDDAQSAATQSLGDKPGVEYTDLEGNVITLSEYEGSVRIVNSWATWCPFCVQELADFQTLASEYQDVVVIAINRKEQKQKVKNFINKIGDLSDIVFVMDTNDSFYGSVGGFAMPKTVFYDTKGNIVFQERGFMNLEDMRTHTQATIEHTQ